MVGERLPPSLSLVALIALAGLLAGCVATGSAGDIAAAQASASSGPARGGPAACTRPIGAFERVLENDRRIGHLGTVAHNRILGELNAARSACAAARVREANRELAEVRARHGYR
jgi:hypothetical protein